MINYLNNHAETIILVVVFALLILSVIVFIGALYSRWVLNITETRNKKIRDALSDLVIQYIFGDISFEKLKVQLNTTPDYAILLQISSELDKTLEGEEEERLKRLYLLKPIRDFFLKRFKSNSHLEKAKACLYYSKLNQIKINLLPKFIDYTKSDYPMLAYSAAMAVIAHGNMDQKKEAIHHLLINFGLSNQALNDIFVDFQKRSSEDSREEADLLMDLIENGSYIDYRIAVMIRTLGELNVYEAVDFLFKKFEKLPLKHHNAAITTSLIDVLSSFSDVRLLDRLHTDFSTSKHREVREASARAMGVFTNPASIEYLKWMLSDPDFYVRFHAAFSLSNFPDLDLKKIKHPAESETDWQELIGEVEANRENLLQ